MKAAENTYKYSISFLHCLILVFITLIGNNGLFAQSESMDLARYTPHWLHDGFADAGATHEDWIFQVRRNGQDFNQWQKNSYDYQLSEPYIKALAESGI